MRPEDIASFRTNYRGSVAETDDIKLIYVKVKGNIDKLYEYVMCSDPLEDEERFCTLIQGWITKQEVPLFADFTRTVKDAGKRAAEAMTKRAEASKEEKKKKKDDDFEALSLQLMANNKHRVSALDDICAKYEQQAAAPKKKGETKK